MTGQEINNDAFDENMMLKSKESCILILTLSTCITCNNYKRELDNKNIDYKFMTCTGNNMNIISKIAYQFHLQSLSVPIVLKYRDGKLDKLCSNKIRDINMLI